jgi:hypothetical protein
MTEGPNGKLPSFKVALLGPASEETKRILKDAQTAGTKQEIESALETITHRLRRDPLGFGELVREFKSMNLVEHVAVVRPLVVTFGINLQAGVVFISRIRLLSPGN